MDVKENVGGFEITVVEARSIQAMSEICKCLYNGILSPTAPRRPEPGQQSKRYPVEVHQIGKKLS